MRGINHSIRGWITRSLVSGEIRPTDMSKHNITEMKRAINGILTTNFSVLYIRSLLWVSHHGSIGCHNSHNRREIGHQSYLEYHQSQRIQEPHRLPAQTTIPTVWRSISQFIIAQTIGSTMARRDDLVDSSSTSAQILTSIWSSTGSRRMIKVVTSAMKWVKMIRMRNPQECW